jgi:hypothetical protein
MTDKVRRAETCVALPPRLPQPSHRMRTAGKLIAIALLCCCALQTSKVLAFGRKPAPRTPFSQGYYEPAIGRVGYHMVSFPTWYRSDEPGTPCSPGFTDVSLDSGTVPPGLVGPYSNAQEWSSKFEGTPRQPGDWQLQVTLYGIHCRQGSDQQDYGNRTIQVHLHIDP